MQCSTLHFSPRISRQLTDIRSFTTCDVSFRPVAIRKHTGFSEMKTTPRDWLPILGLESALRPGKRSWSVDIRQRRSKWARVLRLL